MAVIPPSFSDEYNVMCVYESDEDFEAEQAAEEHFRPENIVDLEPIVPLTEELMIDYINGILENLSQIQDDITTLEGCEMVISALENILVPNCEYLLQMDKKIPVDLQQKMSAIANHITNAHEYVMHSTHRQNYVYAAEHCISSELTKLGMFAQDLARAKKREEAEKQAFIQQFINQIPFQTIEEIERNLFIFCVEIQSRGMPLPPGSKISLALQKIGEEGLSSTHLKLISPDQIDFLARDGDSPEAMDIVENLITEVKSRPKVQM